MENQTHESDPRILSMRSLASDHRRLADLLEPGMSVLDVGCGSGAITAGIASAVGPKGAVVGLDRDEDILAVAREKYSDCSNLVFELGDASSIGFDQRFDIVTAARTLQWIANAEAALRSMASAVKPGGLLVVLDYNHELHRWDPEPPGDFLEFYQAFLKWRESNHLDNRMADHLEHLFHAAGLQEVEGRSETETVARGEADFPKRSMMWAQIIDTVGKRLAAAGFFAAERLEPVRNHYADWARSTLARQTLYLRSVAGRVSLSA